MMIDAVMTTQQKNNNSNSKKAVRFSTVTVRHYAVCLNDNPSCYDGLSIGLDWRYNVAESSVDIRTYEEAADLGLYCYHPRVALPGGYWYEGHSSKSQIIICNKQIPVATKAKKDIQKEKKSSNRRKKRTRRQHDMVLSRTERAAILKEIWGYSNKEMEDAVCTNVRYLKTLHTVYELYLKRQLLSSLHHHR